MNPAEYSISRKEAAEITGLTDVQLRNLMNRDGLFESKRRGAGHPLSFTIRELMQIGVVKVLMRIGWSSSDAVAVVEPLTVHGQLIEVGYFRLGWSVTRAKMCPLSRDLDQPTLDIPLWPIFDEIIDSWIGDDIDDECAEYLRGMNRLRPNSRNG